MKRLSGKRWLEFDLYGFTWRARILPAKHKILDKGKAYAIVFFDEHVMYFSDAISMEQLRTSLAHEIQHVIEEHADVDYGVAHTPENCERCTDTISRGWLYLIRSCPEIVAIFQGKD